MEVWTTQLEMKVEAVQAGTVEWEYKEMKWCENFGSDHVVKGCEAEFLEPTFSWMAFNFRYLSWKKKDTTNQNPNLEGGPVIQKALRINPSKFGDGCVITEKPQIILLPEWMDE